MKPNEFDFDLEDIITEFENYTPEPRPRRKRSARRAEAQTAAETVSETAAEQPAEESAPEPAQDPYADYFKHSAPDPQPEPAPEPIPEAESEPEQSEREAEERPSETENGEEGAPQKKKTRKKKQKKATAEDEAEESAARKPSFGKRFALGLLSLVFACASLLGLAWSLQNIHPEAATAENARTVSDTTDLSARVTNSVYNSKAEALSNIAYIRKQYTIPEEQLVAPVPDPACYGTVSIDNADAVLDVIQKARDSGLLDGQDVIFNPDAPFYYDSNIQYYCDDTILVICWKESIDGFTCSCVEVKIADASQIRRKITEDTFGSPLRVFASELSNSVNAVVAMNADFYMFRDFGIMAYNRRLYRMDDSVYTGMYKKYNCVDTLFVDDQGDFQYFHRLQESNWDQMQQYITDNNILFSVSFGPVLVENGILQSCDWYPAGEVTTGYSRAGIGQYDKLHYFYMSLNHSPERAARWTVDQFGREMYNKGLNSAYCLDGGQTSEIVFRGVPYNYIDFGAERGVSDILYFATAIPESEVKS